MCVGQGAVWREEDKTLQLKARGGKRIKGHKSRVVFKRKRGQYLASLRGSLTS